MDNRKNKEYTRRLFLKEGSLYLAGLSLLPFIKCDDNPSSPQIPETVFSPPENFEIAIFSDIHRGVNSSGPLQNPDDALKEGVAYIKSLTSQPDFLITAGDNILGREAITCTEAQEIEALQTFKGHLEDNLDIPVYLCHGNHDSPLWNQYMGEKHYTFLHKNVNFIVTSIDYIDDLRDGGAGYYTQDEFLRNSLEQNKDRLNMIFIHNPIYPSTFIAESSDHVVSILEEEYKDTTIIVVQGHLHIRQFEERGNVSYITTTRQDSKDMHDFFWVTFTESSVDFNIISQQGTGSYDGQEQRLFVSVPLPVEASVE